ncbi:MAG: fibronectin type III-like domain-contianing protein, partial [Flavitalea sp.]
SWEDQNVDAILETWYGGTKAGEAIADVLFGEANPSGKITMTYPRNVGQVPIYYNHKMTGRPFDANQKYTTKYLDVANTPLYPFGYGLSYTKFNYSDMSLSSATMQKGGTITAKVTLSNSGTFNGVETVQLYIRDLVGSITRPVKELKGFQQVSLKAGESKTISFTIKEEDLKFYNADLKWVSEPGEFEVFIGGSSAIDRGIKFELK